MGDLSTNATVATWLGAFLIAAGDVQYARTVLVGACLPFVFFSVIGGCRSRLVWAVDAAFVTGLVVATPFYAFVGSSVAFAVVAGV